MIFANGRLVAQGRQFSIYDVDIITAVVHVDANQEHRPGPLQNVVYFGLNPDRNLSVDHDVCSEVPKTTLNGHRASLKRQTFSLEELMAKGPACWLWDYLRRSNAAGFVVSLSGGIDSGCTAIIVFSMCRIVMRAIQDGNTQVEADLQRVVGLKGWKLRTTEELCNRNLHTIYMGVSGHSSEKTRSRARGLTEALGAYHTDLSRQYLGHTPTFNSGLPAENLALQNIQARIRMVTTYHFAQMLPSTRGRSGSGTFLVLGSINVEKCLRGSLTKHDCSSADLSPIDSFSKLQIRDLIRWARASFDLPVLDDFLNAISSAELEPRRFEQHDFKDMGMIHHELYTLGKLRKESRLGPFSIFQTVLLHWRSQKSPDAIVDLVKKFHRVYAINRHRMGTMTPALSRWSK